MSIYPARARSILAACFLVVFSIACGRAANSTGDSSTTQSRPKQILGGKPASQAPDRGYWSVAKLDLEISLNGVPKMNGLCTGVLIDKDIILTAAHCLRPDLTQNGVSVAATGFASFSQVPNTRFAIKKMISHPDFRLERSVGWLFRRDLVNRNDVALVLLEQEVEEPLRPARLFVEFPANGSKLQVRAYGYGSTFNGDGESQGLRYVDLNASVETANQRIVFDQSGGQGICHGDSGGPSFVYVDGRPRVIGIANNGTGVWLGQDICRSQGAEALVPYHLEWIQNTVRRIRR